MAWLFMMLFVVSSRSVTFMGEAGCDPMALTATTYTMAISFCSFLRVLCERSNGIKPLVATPCSAHTALEGARQRAMSCPDE